MNKLFYFLLKAFSKLPLPLLYAFSDVIFVLNFYVLGYRKKIVADNLRKAFPNKSDKEIKRISKAFFRNFSDYLVETIKAITIGQQELNSRHTYQNLELFDKYKAQNQNVMLLVGHVFNWEWFIGTVKHLPSEHTHAIYHRIHNPFWNERVNEIRSRFGTNQIEMNRSIREIMKTENNGEHTYFFVADQKPARGTTKTFIPFLGQKTPVYEGFTKLAAKKNLGVIYCDVVKLKRGHYQTTFREISKNLSGEPDEKAVLLNFFSALEDTINRNPDNWLWSHRRWKYQSLEE